ncbi:signal recognition particle protein [Aquipuribacter sp. SD81]|uniref:signal recognition particle protein n=1 Tax=Aquipuribacter sp. SD81 TaxID=3127703 RepID=UPI0030165602
MFASLSDRLTSTFKSLRGKGRLSPADVDATVRQIRLALLDADVSLPVVRQFTASVRERALGEEVSKALNPGQQVVKIVNEELVAILGGETRRLRLAKNPPTVIMLAGLQGAGKTTLAGKLGHWLKEQGHSPVLVAADLQRPNAVTQLQVNGERAGVAVFAPEPGNGVGDPVDVARRGVELARSRGHDVVVVDTAGRLGVDADLMQQAADIRDAVQPDEVLFVLDAMIGQSAVETAKQFDEGVSLTGVVMTKLDGDARGGAALSVVTVTGSPILFASTGEKLTDFEVFHPDRMAGRILDMGDVLTLIEQAERAFDAEQTAKMAGKVERGEDFTLSDFLEQMQAVRRMGPLKNMLKMLPGMGDMKEQLEQFDERELDRVEAIVRSMTPAERDDLKILNGSRRARIARGSGTQVSDVNGLVERFTQAQKMMRQMRRGGGMPGLPGMPGGGMPGGVPGMVGPGKRGKQKKGKAAARKGSRSGNPAKRAAEEAGLGQRGGAAAGSGSGAAFGLSEQGGQSFDPASLPDAFRGR